MQAGARTAIGEMMLARGSIGIIFKIESAE